MNNALNFYSGNKQEILKMTGINSSNYEFELISSFSNQTKDPTNAIEIITDMAKTGKIDPWNVDVVKVYDEYMKTLSELNAQNNLKFIGRGFVFASALLNLKSRVLSGLSLADVIPPEPLEDMSLEDSSFEIEESMYEERPLPTNNIISFNEVLQRRTSTKLNRSRTITIKDLIRHLKFYEELERRKSNNVTRVISHVRNYTKMTTNDILDMAQDEFIEDAAKKMDDKICNILKTKEKVELSSIKDTGLSLPASYIALLHLCVRGKYDIEQEEFYGDLYIKLPKEELKEAL